jgi:hypothetical protein
VTRSTAFDLAALYAALDAQRQARGLTWRGAMREINHVFETTTSRPISQSTVTSLRTKVLAEGDGVLQMLRWLNRAPESFAADVNAAARAAATLPEIPAHLVLRFDTARLHAALNAQRVERGLSWPQVADEIGGRATAAVLTHLKQGGRTGFPDVMRMVGWLKRPVADFTRATRR